MAKGDLIQIRVTPEQKELLLVAAGALSLSEYIFGQLFDTTPRLNDAPKRIGKMKQEKPITAAKWDKEVMKDLASLKPLTAVVTQTGDTPIGKPWSSFGKMRTLYRRPDGTEYEGWLN